MLLRTIHLRRKGIINLRPHKDIINLRRKGIIHLRPRKGTINLRRKGISNLLPHKDTTNPLSTTLHLGPDHRLRRLGTCPLLISHIRC
jgi:hypothetical protein